MDVEGEGVDPAQAVSWPLHMDYLNLKWAVLRRQSLHHGNIAELLGRVIKEDLGFKLRMGFSGLQSPSAFSQCVKLYIQL